VPSTVSIEPRATIVPSGRDCTVTLPRRKASSPWPTTRKRWPGSSVMSTSSGSARARARCAGEVRPTITTSSPSRPVSCVANSM
jgi:hypothetical protein